MVAFRHSSYRLEIRKSSTKSCHYYWLGWELPCWDGSCPVGMGVALLGWELPCWDGSCPVGMGVALLGWELPYPVMGVALPKNARIFWDLGIPFNQKFQLFLRRSQGIEYPEGCVNKSSSSKFLNGKEWEKPWKKSLLTLEQRGFLCQGPCDFSEWTMMMRPEKKLP